ncbi:hypothetical protein Vafri_5575, partial [Volvox africanus]
PGRTAAAVQTEQPAHQTAAQVAVAVKPVQAGNRGGRGGQGGCGGGSGRGGRSGGHLTDDWQVGNVGLARCGGRRRTLEMGAKADGGARRTRQCTDEGPAAEDGGRSANQGVAGVGGTVAAPVQLHARGVAVEPTEAGGPHEKQEQQQGRQEQAQQRQQRQQREQREQQGRNAAPSGSGPQSGAPTTAAVAGRPGVAGPAPAPWAWPTSRPVQGGTEGTDREGE